MDAKIEKLKKIIKKEGLITKAEGQQKIVDIKGEETSWLFDLRNIFLKPGSLSLIAEIFWSYFEKEYPFQIGGQGVAAIPLISAIVLKNHQTGKPINGFIIRKSRKPIGLQKIIEGELNENKIILVDDLLNSGSTILRQIKVLEEAGKKVDWIFTLVRFHDEEYYKFIKEKQIKLVSLFSLKDFELSLEKKFKEAPQNFKIVWRFRAPDPNYFYVVPKSAPAIDEKKIYFGSDSGYFWALNQKDGSVAWNFKVGFPVNGKSIFSSPAIYKNTIYFGAYDGNVYALDTETGAPTWIFREADWVGSSPSLAPDLNLLFIGLEFGLLGKHGGIAALDLKTGEKKWEYYKMAKPIHCSPAYCPEKKIVAIGGNDCYVYLFNAKSGELKWKFKTEGEIKASLVFDDKRNLLLFGAFDKNLYATDLNSGELKGKFKTEDIISSTPAIYKDNVIFSSLDKNVYSLNLDTGKLNWRFVASGRVFSSPVIIENKICIGSNGGSLYEIDAETGELIDFFQATERIVNKIAHNPSTKRFFVPTYANEIYCLEKTIKK